MLNYNNKAGFSLWEDLKKVFNCLVKRIEILESGGGGGADGVVSNVTLNGTNLEFTGSNGGFNGPVDLSSLAGAGSPDLVSDWQPNTAYVLNQEIKATDNYTGRSTIYRRTTAGTSGAGTFDTTEQANWTPIADLTPLPLTVSVNNAGIITSAGDIDTWVILTSTTVENVQISDMLNGGKLTIINRGTANVQVVSGTQTVFSASGNTLVPPNGTACVRVVGSNAYLTGDLV